MDLKQAERNIRIVSLFCFISIPASYFFFHLSCIEFPLSLYLFMPWLFPGLEASAEAWWPLVIVIILTNFVYFNRSRVAAILLLVVHILFRILIFALMSLPFLSETLIFMIIWHCINLIWGLLLIQGIRATFVYHRIKR